MQERERSQEELKANKPLDPSPRDSLLAFLVNLCNESSLEVGITLTVGGNLITGKLISGRKYCNEVASQMEAAGETGATIAKYYREFGEEYFGKQDDDNFVTPEMIHLENAKVVGAGSVIQNLGFWRGRLRSVEGHTIGELGLSDK